MIDRKVKIKTGSFDPVPADKYTVQILNVDLVTRSFKGVESEKLNYQYVILDDKPMPEDSDRESTRGKYIWHAVSETFGERAWLTKLINATLGKSCSKDDLKAAGLLTKDDEFDANCLVGKQVDVMLDQTEKDNVTYNNVVNYSKTLKPLKNFTEDSGGEQVEVESASKPAVAKQAEVPNLNPALDSFLDDLDSEKEKEIEETEEEVVEEEDESLEELEAKLKLAKAKKAKAKK